MSIKLLKKIGLALFITLSSCGFAQTSALPNGFAHNDYMHKRPLLEALENGYTNIEADVFLHNNKLIVAHFSPFFKKNRTLENLYLKPLYEYIKQHNGRIYENYTQPLILMIDIKSSANITYQALKPLLEKYSSILSVSEEGKLIPGKVTIILSGHKPYDLINSEKKNLAFIDTDFKMIYQDRSKNVLYPMTSCKYSHMIKWKGKGKMFRS